MDFNLLIGILSVVIATIAAYHIAGRQGAFNKVKLILYPTIPDNRLNTKKRLSYSWFVINSCELPSTYGENKLLIHLPITIENMGKAAAENVRIAITYSSVYSTIDLGNDSIYHYPQSKIDLIKRFHHQLPYGQCQSIYEFSFMPSNTTASFFDILSYDPIFLERITSDLEKQAFQGDKEIAIAKMNYQVTAKNSSQTLQGYFWLISTKETNFEVFIDKHHDAVGQMLELFDERVKRFKRRKLWLPYPRRFFSKLLYSNLGVNYNYAFKEICGYGFMEDSSKKLHATEAFEVSKLTCGLVRIPFYV